jgi:hypothetical protein
MEYDGVPLRILIQGPGKEKIYLGRKIEGIRLIIFYGVSNHDLFVYILNPHFKGSFAR